MGARVPLAAENAAGLALTDPRAAPQGERGEPPVAQPKCTGRRADQPRGARQVDPLG